MEIFFPYLRVTQRLAAEIHQMCKVMTVTDVARHFQLDWKTVKDIDKQNLEAHYGQPDLEWLRLLVMDEISIELVLNDGCKLGPFSPVMQMAYAEVLLDDVSDLRDGLVTLDLEFGQLGGGGVLANDAILNLIERQKVPVGFTGVALIGIDLFDLLEMHLP